MAQSKEERQRSKNKWNLEYQKSPEQVHNRVMRNKARREMIREGKAHVGDGMDVDHRQMLKDGGSNARSNLRMRSRHANRGWSGNK